jgi:hypothetical protein
VLKKDLASVESGKPGALGLSKTQYQELIGMGEKRKVELAKTKEE